MSDNYIVSARKYRPSSFRSVVGQKELTATLRNSVATGRLAQAYLFCGPRGVGKTSCARIFAKAVNCLNPVDGEACGCCESCKAIDSGNSFNIVELDAASNNGVENIREITQQVNVPPQLGKYRIFIIDEVHMLSSAAFNAFLKTLEEPPAYAIFILATTEKHKVIPTILSRCQIYDFKRITVDDIVEHLGYVAREEGIAAESKALGVIARKADGAMRDALSIFDQLAASCNNNLTYQAVIENLNVLDYDYFFKLVNDFRTGDVADALLLYSHIRDNGFDSLVFVNSLAQHVRDLMVAADKRTRDLLEVPADVAEQLTAQASQLPLPWYYTAMGLLNDCDYRYRTTTNKQLLVELTLIRLCQLLNPAPAPFDNPLRKAPLRELVAQPQKVSTEEKPAISIPPATSIPPVTEPQQMPAMPAAHKESLGIKTPAESPAHTRNRKARTATFSISDVDGDAEADTERSEPFTDEQFAAAWNELAARHADQHNLADAMRSAKISRTGDISLHMQVMHAAQLQALEMSLPDLLTEVRNILRNDFVTINVNIDTSASRNEPKHNPADFLRDVVQNNPLLGSFLKDIDGEII